MRWIENLSAQDYQNDILILAGDISDAMPLVVKTFHHLRLRFKHVFYIPGNHDLWTVRNKSGSSLEVFDTLLHLAEEYGIQIGPAHFDTFSIVPLFGWYDFSFGDPGDDIYKVWADFVTCKWPPGFDEERITQFFLSRNESHLNTKNQFIISFSHFLPRIDLMPFFIPRDKRRLYPVLGTQKLEQQIRQLNSNIHIYGHSHVNQRVKKKNTLYINNAFGYPYETYITAKQLLCIHEV